MAAISMRSALNFRVMRTPTLAIRLSRMGCTNRPFYHIVVSHKHKGSQKPPIEQIGTYDPLPNSHGECLVSINFDRLKYWIRSGARTNATFDNLLGLSGFFPIHPQSYWEAHKKNLKEANTSSPLEENAEKDSVNS